MFTSGIRKCLWSIFFISQLLHGKERAHIALVYDGVAQQEDPFSLQVQEELTELLAEEFSLRFFPMENHWSLSGAKRSIEEALQDPKIDLVITLGILTSYEMLKQKNLPKAAVIGYNVSIFSDPNITFSIQNDPKIAFYQSPITLAEEIETFASITKAKKIAFLGDASLIGDPAFPLLRNKIEQKMASIQVVPIFIPIREKASSALQALEETKSDGVVLLPLWRMSLESFRVLIDGITSRHLPSFSLDSEEKVEEGVLMTLTPKGEIKRAARRVALDAQELLLSGNNKEIVFSFFRSKELLINERTAYAIGIDLPWKVIREATFIERIKVSKEESLSFIDATTLALQRNLDLLTECYVVKKGWQEVIQRFSRLMPQLNSQLLGRIVDANTARSSFGQQSEKKIRSSLLATQMLYDERRVANFSIERKLQAAREFNRQSFELDIVLATAISYLRILRAIAEYKIAMENISLSKANLKRAQELVDSGQARLSEVYRWESELASNRDNLVGIEVIIENRKTEFNRLLNRPLNTPVHLQDITPFKEDIFLDYGQLVPYVNTPSKFEYFKCLMINFARENSPSIKEITQQILAEERNFLAAKRDFYLPKFFAFGELNNNLYNGGIGDSTPPGISNAKLESAVGITAFYPFFTGGKRSSEKNKSFFELQRLKTERASLIERIDEQVIQSIDNMKARYEEIFLAKEAAEASEKNLTIVTNSYTRGIISIVDLLDAQNQMIVSKQNYFNSLYDYLISYMEFQRATSQYDFYLDADMRALFKKNLIQSLSQSPSPRNRSSKLLLMKGESKESKG